MSLPATEDTIAAIATAPGAAAIGIVRLPGPDSRRIAGRLFRPRSGTAVQALQPGTFSVGLFEHAGEPVDEGLLLVFGEGRSYTGQEAVEMQVHGSSAVLKRLLEATLAEGARPAGPGEFTLRAYLGGKLDLAQAESVLALIEAEGDAARRNALSGLSGGLSRRLDELQTELTGVYAGLQASLDYPDEGVEEHDFSGPLSRVLETINELLGSARAGRIAGSGARLALLGRPNSGKSSLLNALAGYERSLVSSTPGTTRDYLEERLELGGIPVTVTDTAGMRSSTDEVEARGVELSRRLADSADLVLVLLDPFADSAAEPETEALLALADPERRVIVWSKSDLT
ncbi:MAG TPA: GTPase, partial [Deinococcales bacterium]|nr:GTPase [Deinococcales bacterium]